MLFDFDWRKFDSNLVVKESVAIVSLIHYALPARRYNACERSIYQDISMKRSICSLIPAMLVLGLTIGLAGPVRANIVLNGNFGTGDLSHFNLAGDTSEVFVQQTGSTSFAAALTTASADGFLSQALVTTVGQAYSGSFLLIGDGATPNSFAASVAGVTLVSQTNVPNTQPSGTTFSFAFVASSTSSLLSFDFRDDPGFLHLTNIVVNPTISAVPEPSSVVGLSLGTLILVGHFGWKQRR